MTPDALSLLDRKIGRLKDEHISKLLAILNESLRLIDISRRATVSESLYHFAQASFDALKQYTGNVRSEVLSFSEQTRLGLAEDSRSSILNVVSKHLDENLYPNRFHIYEEAFSRHMGRFGLSIDLTAYRADLVMASHHAATSNFIRGFFASLTDDLEMLSLRISQSIVSGIIPPESRMEQANRILKLEPNFFGLGINLNYLIGKIFRKKSIPPPPA